jgi:hypothetical protein
VRALGRSVRVSRNPTGQRISEAENWRAERASPPRSKAGASSSRAVGAVGGRDAPRRTQRQPVLGPRPPPRAEARCAAPQAPFGPPHLRHARARGRAEHPVRRGTARPREPRARAGWFTSAGSRALARRRAPCFARRLYVGCRAERASIEEALVRLFCERRAPVPGATEHASRMGTKWSDRCVHRALHGPAHVPARARLPARRSQGRGLVQRWRRWLTGQSPCQAGRQGDRLRGSR